MDQNFLTTEEAKKADVGELLRKLSANQEGLSSEEAEKRLLQYGPNEIQEKKVNPLKKFLDLFLGSNSLDDRSSYCNVRHNSALARLRNHNCPPNP